MPAKKNNENTLYTNQKYRLNSDDRFGLKMCNRMGIRHTSFCCTIYKSHLTSGRKHDTSELSQKSGASILYQIEGIIEV